MPRASELEEFGLEVESEHHALMQQTSNSRQPLELASPTKRQVKLLQSTNTKRFRPGMLKWALLVFALAVIVFLNIGQEGKIETELLEGEESAEEQEAKALNEHKGDWAEDKGEYRVFGDEGKKDNLHIEEEAEETILEHHGGIQVPVGNVPLHKGFTNADAEKAKAEAAAKAKAEVASTEEADSSETETSGNSEAAETTSTTEMPITEKPKNTPVSKPQSSGNNNSGGKFTQKRLLATRAAAQDLIKLLEDYYYGSETMSKMLIKSWVGPWDFEANVDEMDEMVQKMVDTMIRALVTEDQTEFIIGTIGSSVAAGHDNCNYDSYENQLQRTLGPVWEAAGMNLVCQNAGEGGGCGDNFANQVFCIKQNVSPKIDIAHYTWSYFEVGDHDGALVSRENLIRWTQMMPKQPPVHVINVEGSVEVAWDEKDLQKHYAKYGYNAFYMRYAYRQGGYDYDTEAKNGIDRFGWGYVGDGYHNTTRYGELEEDEGRRDSLGVLLRNWHPGPLGFQLISDAFSMIYSKAILVALDIIEELIKDGKNPNEIWDASKRKIVSKKSLPDPMHCDPEYCVVDDAPGCLNYELPTYGTRGPRVEDPNDDLNPFKGEVQKWTMWQEPKDFWHLVAKEDVVYFQDREDKKICKHLDNCAGISATSAENGMVVFRLPKMEVGLVAICVFGDVIPLILNNTNIEVGYNGALLDRANWDAFPNGKCARLLKRFPTEGAAAQTPTGHAYLSIKALDGLEAPVRISHVITL